MIKMLGATKRYPNGVVALNTINLHIKRGEFVFIVGPSGAGKSTFIKTLLKEEDLTSGALYIDDLDVGKLHRRRVPGLRRKMGVVFQDFRLLPNKTVYENVAFALEITGTPSSAIRRKVARTLSVVDLGSKHNMYPDQLSGGEQQRVSVARALVNNPPILIADEPTGNLDPDTSMEIVKLLNHINRNGTTIIMATHDRAIVDFNKKRVVAIENGRIVRDEEQGAYGYVD